MAPYVFGEKSGGVMRSVRDAQHKLYAKNGKPTGLYDLRVDPFERENRVRRDDLRQVRERLAAALRGWRP